MLPASKYVFFGTPEFAAIILEGLIRANMAPAAVVCNPDRPVGRKKIITPPPTKALLMKHEARSIEILQPEKLDGNFKRQISNIKPEFGIVAAYAKIIPKDVIELFSRGIIGVHPSLLPKYRGSSPIQSAVLDGEKETGVTLYILDEKVDHGPILAQKRFMVHGSWTYLELQKKLAELGGALLVETLPRFLKGEMKPQAQNENEATYTKKFTGEDGFVREADLQSALAGKDLQKTLEIERKIRALNPEPGAWTMSRSMVHGSWSMDTKRIKLLESEIKDGKLKLKKIQEEGGKPKLVSSF